MTWPDDAPRCATCRHWEHRPPSSPDDDGVCSLAISLQRPSPGQPRFEVVPDDDPYVNGTLYTSADFGCILHEPKGGGWASCGMDRAEDVGGPATQEIRSVSSAVDALNVSTPGR